MKKIALAAVLCAVTLPALAKGPQCQYYPQNERMSVLQVQKDLLNQGYTIREFDYDNNCYEVEVRDQNGKRSEIYLDAKTGKEVERFQKNRNNRTPRNN
ncbi:MAG: PepSY domain-containing protein [Neisseria sp.]|nr:PepSY domain-containing protein [Neisseria sp.]